MLGIKYYEETEDMAKIIVKNEKYFQIGISAAAGACAVIGGAGGIFIGLGINRLINELAATNSNTETFGRGKRAMHMLFRESVIQKKLEGGARSINMLNNSSKYVTDSVLAAKIEEVTQRMANVACGLTIAIQVVNESVNTKVTNNLLETH